MADVTITEENYNQIEVILENGGKMTGGASSQSPLLGKREYIYFRLSIIVIIILLSTGCREENTASNFILPTSTPYPTNTIETAQISRTLLTYDDLLNRNETNSPVEESALAYPAKATSADHTFDGHLKLTWDPSKSQFEYLHGELSSQNQTLPTIEIDFVQSEGYLIPVQRGLIILEHPGWNIIIEPGRVWQEMGDRGYSRASFPFALVVKGSNATFNGTMTFLFDDQHVSPVWYQITQETILNVEANMWGFFQAEYQPKLVANGNEIKAAFLNELAERFPTKPIESLADDYPGVDISAFSRNVVPEHMTWYGFVINDINYIGGCETRFGIYPYCEYMRAPAYGTTNSGFVSIALMRLAQIYGPEVMDLLIKDYLPETAASPGNWDTVTFNHTLDMSTGNYGDSGHMTDESSNLMETYLSTQPYEERIAIALNWPNSGEPGETWIYHSSDSFILVQAMNNFLITQQGPDADIFDFVVEEVFLPLDMGPGVMSILRTSEDNWHGHPLGSYGMWWIPDDIAKLGTLLSNGGQINGQQILHPGLLAAALQQNPDDRGIKISDPSYLYNNSFRAQHYSSRNCDFWVPVMQGESGNIVAFFPNETFYYYFSDNQNFFWEDSMRESNKLVPFCNNGN